MDLRRLCVMRSLTAAWTCVHAQTNSYVWVVCLCNMQPFNCQGFFFSKIEKERKEIKRASVRRHNIMRADTSFSCCFFLFLLLLLHICILCIRLPTETQIVVMVSKTKRNILPNSRADSRVISVAEWSHFCVTSGSYFTWTQMCYSLSLTGQIEDEASPFIKPLDLCWRGQFCKSIIERLSCRQTEFSTNPLWAYRHSFIH